MSEGTDTDGFRLDVVVEASGFGRKDMKLLEEVSRTGMVFFLALISSSTWKTLRKMNRIAVLRRMKR
jgi:hypothetical protein